MPRRASARTSRSSMSVGLIVIQMVVAKQVQSPVDEQMRRMRFDRDRLFGGLPLAHAFREDDVAEHQLRTFARIIQLVRLDEWEGKDVGRLVLAAPLRVQRPNFARRRSGGPRSRPGASHWRVAGRRFPQSRIRRRGGRAATSRCYCPIPRPILCRSRASSLRPGTFIGVDNASDQRMAHDVGGGEAHDLDRLDALQLADRVVEARRRRRPEGRSGSGRRRSPSGCACRSG